MRPRKTKQIMHNNSKIIAIFLAFFAFLISGCQPNPAILNSQRGSDQPDAVSSDENVERPQDEFEFALKRMQKSGFTHIFAMRRKDGGTIDKEDGKYIKQNSPPGTNQFVVTDKERAVLAGSNFPFTGENLEMLRDRLTVEDFSPKENVNANQSN